MVIQIKNVLVVIEDLVLLKVLAVLLLKQVVSYFYQVVVVVDVAIYKCV